MAANNIYIQVDLNSQSAQQNVNALNNAIASTGQVSQQSSNKATTALSSVQVSVNQTTKAFGELTTAIAGLGITRAVQSMMQSAAEFSRAQQAMTLFAGSAEDARKVIEQVQAIARQSPFRFEELQQSAREMLGFGIAAKDVPVQLKAITDQVTAMGGSMEEVEGIVKIFGKIMETDIVSAMALIRKLPAEGVPTMKAFRAELSKSLNIDATTKDVQDAMKKGLLDPQQTLRVLTETMGKVKVPVNDAAVAFKNLGDELHEMGAEFFGPNGFGPALTQLAKDIESILAPIAGFIKLLERLPEPAKEWIVRIGAISVAVAAMAGVIALAATVFGPLITVIGGFIALLPEILTVVGALSGIGAILYKTVPGVKTFADNLKTQFDELKAKGEEFKAALDKLFLPKGDVLDREKQQQLLQSLLEETIKTADSAKRTLLEGLSSPVAAVELKWKDLFDQLEDKMRDLKPELKQSVRDMLSQGEAAELAAARFKVDKQEIDQRYKYEEDKAKGSYEAQIAYIEALDEQGVQKRVAAIDQITELRIASAHKVADIETAQLQEIFEAQKALLEDPRFGFKPEQIAAAEKDLQDQMNLKRRDINEKAFDDEQKYRLEGWKKANDIIIEDQKRVFEQFQSFFDEMFDALTGKSKDIGKAITDIFKKELLGEARNIFSTVLAQGATTAAGYGTPEADFRRGGGIFSTILMRGMPPRPPGPPPEIYNPAHSESALKDYQGPIQGSANRLMASADVYSNSTIVFARAVQQFATAAPSSQGYAERRMADDQLVGPEPHITIGAPGQTTQAQPYPIVSPDEWASMQWHPAATMEPPVAIPSFGGGGYSLPTGWGIPNIAPPGGGGGGFNLQSLFKPMTATSTTSYADMLRNFKLNFGIGTAPMKYGGFGVTPGLESLKAAASMGGGGTSFGSVLGSKGMASLYGAIGTPLAMAGIFGTRQGTAGGLLESTLGLAGLGASIGSVIPGLGTALGAGIGAAAGLGIGLGEMIAGVESPRNQAKRLAGQLYHININNATADQIVALAQQSYGGNVGIAMRSPQVRQMLGVYAAGTGQANQFSQGLGVAHGASLVESGGSLMQQATYQYGNPYTYGSDLPVYGGQPTHVLGAPGGGVNLSLNIAGQDAAKFLTGNVVSPDVVQTQYATAMQSSNGRVPQALMLSSPGSIVS